ncbi:hypothetical protein ABE322_25300 [Priestia megaterium]
MLSILSKKFIYTYIQQEKLTPINKEDQHIECHYELDISVTMVNEYIKQEFS